MSQNTSKKIFWIFFFLFLGIYLILCFQSVNITHYLYHQEIFDSLNQITGSDYSQVLGFYVGRLEDLILGPLKSLLSGLLFLGFCYYFLRDASFLKFGSAVFIFLFLTKFEVLFYPVYGEIVMGPHAPGVWLSQNGFNYLGLLQQDSFTVGGPRTYETSIFPFLVATLLTVMPTIKSYLFVFHSLVFFFAAAIVAVFREILSSVFDRDVGLFGPVLILSMPLFQSMTEQLNIELMCTFFVIWSIYFLLQKRMKLASVAAMLAVLTKAPGAIACLTVFGIAILNWIVDSKERKWSDLVWPGLAIVAVIVKSVVRSMLVGQQPSHNTLSFLAGWPNVREMMVFRVFVVVTLVYFGIFLADLLKQTSKEDRINYWKSNVPVITMYLVAGGWFALFLNFSVMGPRYQTVLIPFFWFAVIYVTLYFVHSAHVVKGLFVGLIAFSLLCSHGLIYKKKYESSVYSYNELDRSLEYRNDLELHRQLASEIEKNYSHMMIGAPWVVAHKLAIPEYGYVSKDLDVMIYGMRVTYGGVKTFSGLKEVDIPNTLWVGFAKNHINPQIDYPIGEYDKIIKELVVGDKKVYLFMGGFAIENMRRIIMLKQGGLLDKVLKRKN